VKEIDPEDEATIQRFTTFAHAFSDIKGLNFPDETIEEALVSGFLASLPNAILTAAPETPELPAKNGTHIGYFIGIKDKRNNGPVRAFGQKLYESYIEALDDLAEEFSSKPGKMDRDRGDLVPYTERKDYEIVPAYR
jgi:hypothetical protein